MTIVTVPRISAAGQRIAGKIDSPDFEPVAFKLIQPDPVDAAMTLAEADEAIAAHRCFLKLCAWYPEETIVPSRAIEVWHAQILDTAKYADDTGRVFGDFLHHFPYLGLRGPEDVARWQAALRADWAGKGTL